MLKCRASRLNVSHSSGHGRSGVRDPCRRPNHEIGRRASVVTSFDEPVLPEVHREVVEEAGADQHGGVGGPEQLRFPHVVRNELDGGLENPSDVLDPMIGVRREERHLVVGEHFADLVRQP